MSDYYQSFQGIVIANRPHRENDAIVKIFTEKFGKKSFFIRNSMASNSVLTNALTPLVCSVYLGHISQSGLSFLKDSDVLKSFLKIRSDPFLQAHATYYLALTDAAFEDNVPQDDFYSILKESLIKLNSGYNADIVRLQFELFSLRLFGVAPDWNHSQISHKETADKRLNFTLNPPGVILSDEAQNMTVLPVSSKAIHLCRLLANIRPNQLGKLDINPVTVKDALKLLSVFYNDYIGLSLKSRKYLEKMSDWF